MVQHVAQYNHMITPRLAGGNFLNGTLYELHSVTRPIIESSESRCYVDGRDLCAWIRGSELFRYGALAATDFQDATCRGHPVADLRGKLIDVDIEPAVRVRDPTLTRAEHGANHRTKFHN